MKKRNDHHLNKFERMLLESKFPSLRILLEDEEKKEDKKSGESESIDDLFKDNGAKEDKEEKKSGEGDNLDDLFGDSESGSKEGDKSEEGSSDEAAEGAEEPADNSKDEEKDKKAKEEAEADAIKLVAKKAANVLHNVSSSAIDQGVGNKFDDILFGIDSSVNEHIKKKNYSKQMKRLQENISKYLFKNIKFKNQKKLMMLNNFEINERKMLKINKVINEANSVEEIINNEFWEDNAAVDLIVNNAINLTKNFENLIDIPALIINSVAIKFGRQAAEEMNSNKNAENEYRLKLDEFLQGYTKALKQLPDYENYDVEKNRLDNPRPSPAQVGASNPGG